MLRHLHAQGPPNVGFVYSLYTVSALQCFNEPTAYKYGERSLSTSEDLDILHTHGTLLAHGTSVRMIIDINNLGTG